MHCTAVSSLFGFITGAYQFCSVEDPCMNPCSAVGFLLKEQGSMATWLSLQRFLQATPVQVLGLWFRIPKAFTGSQGFLVIPFTLTSKIIHKAKITTLWTFCLLLPSATSDSYPEITFLGTGSSAPNKYRNISCILIQTRFVIRYYLNLSIVYVSV